MHMLVPMLSVNLALLISTPIPAPLTSVVKIEIISIIYEKCYMTTRFFL